MYPYEVVQGPQSASYAGPTVNWSAPLQALTGQRQQNQPAGQQSPQLTAQYAQLLQKLLGGTGSPMQLSPGNFSAGTMGGMGGSLGGVY